MNTFRQLLLTTLLLLSQVGLAQDSVDLLNLSGYEEGDIPTHLLGEQITVRQEVKDGKTIKFVSGQSDKGKINYKISNLSRDFEVVFELGSGNSILISFSANDEAKFDFRTGYYNMQLGDNGSSDKYPDAEGGTNILKIKVESGNVKTYVNSGFFQSMTLGQPDLVYNDLLITDIGTSEKIYSIKVTNLGASSTPITSIDPSKVTIADIEAQFENGKQAGIQQCASDPSSCGISVSGAATGTDGCIANYSVNGELHIPCVNVPGAFGQIETYEVWMQQRSGIFTFDLDLNRIQRK